MMTRKQFLSAVVAIHVVLAIVAACGGASLVSKPSKASAPTSLSIDPNDPNDEASRKSMVLVTNATSSSTTVQVAFSPISSVQGWSFCTSTGSLACSFQLAGKTSQQLPLAGRYLNATIAFGAPSVGCGTTKAELNINNPQPWYDIADVSLVDGFSNKVAIEVVTAGHDGHEKKILGPPVGREGNEKVFGLFPLGCDICVARDQPSCGQSVGKSGCKTGTQYNPDVPCQFQGPIMGGGSLFRVTLEE